MLRALDRRPSVLSSISRSDSGESIWCSMRRISVARRNLFFVGAQKPIKAFAKSCGSSGTSGPPQTAREIEDYQVDLASVKVLELLIVPDIGGGNTYASPENLRLA